jgi:hypothetical protein
MLNSSLNNLFYLFTFNVNKKLNQGINRSWGLRYRMNHNLDPRLLHLWRI